MLSMLAEASLTFAEASAASSLLHNHTVLTYLQRQQQLHCETAAATLWDSSSYIVRQQQMHCGTAAATLWDSSSYIVGQQQLHCGTAAATLWDSSSYIVRQLQMHCEQPKLAAHAQLELANVPWCSCIVWGVPATPYTRISCQQQGISTPADPKQQQLHREQQHFDVHPSVASCQSSLMQLRSLLYTPNMFNLQPGSKSRHKKINTPAALSSTTAYV
jgi:hypothetical protein